jgi:hypothetical protein
MIINAVIHHDMDIISARIMMYVHMCVCYNRASIYIGFCFKVRIQEEAVWRTCWKFEKYFTQHF